MNRYEVSADGQSIIDNRTHAPLPLPSFPSLAVEALMGRMLRSWALEDWAKLLNS